MVEYELVFTGLALTASILYYTLTLRNANRTQQNQLETRQAQFFMSIFDKAQSDSFIDAISWFESTKFENLDEFLSLISGDTPEAIENNKRFNTLGTYYEGLGVLVKEGILDIRWVALMMYTRTTRFMEKVMPILDDWRASTGYSRMASESMYLYNKLVKYMEEHPEL